MKEEIGKTWASAMERDLINDFYNENHMIKPFGNLIDYRVYLSMWVLKKNRRYFLKIKKKRLAKCFFKSNFASLWNFSLLANPHLPGHRVQLGCALYNVNNGEFFFYL